MLSLLMQFNPAHLRITKLTKPTIKSNFGMYTFLVCSQIRLFSCFLVAQFTRISQSLVDFLVME